MSFGYNTIKQTKPDQREIVQSIKLKVAGSKSYETFRRLISKLVLLVSNNNSDDTFMRLNSQTRSLKM